MDIEKFEFTKCNLCGADDFVVYLEQLDKRFSTTPRDILKLVRCHQCGLIYLNPRPTKEYIGEFYPTDFYEQFAEEDAPKSIFKKMLGYLDLTKREEIKALQEKTSIVLKNHPRPGKILDVGCASGKFLGKMMGYGWSATGIDISKDMCDAVKAQYKIECLNVGFNEFDYPANSFNVVTLWASFEHLYDPNAAAKICHKILQEKGIIVILVPNARSLEEKIFKKIDPNPIDIPRHLYHFSERTLGEILRRNGFKVKSVKHFTWNAMDRVTSVLDKYIGLIPPKNNFLKLCRFIGFNSSFVLGCMISRALSIFGRSHTMILVGEKTG